MSEQGKGGTDGFAKAFIPGLVLGLVLGALAGAWLPAMFPNRGHQGAVKGTGVQSDTPREPRERGEADPNAEDPAEVGENGGETDPGDQGAGSDEQPGGDSGGG
ncbi:MAG: hypothetical protein ACF8Q5_07905 [Phycisphaerales bacterium JB040]